MSRATLLGKKNKAEDEDASLTRTHRRFPSNPKKKQVKVLAAAVPPQDDPSFFLEPLMRSFVLGVSAGCIFESLHVVGKVRRERWW